MIPIKIHSLCAKRWPTVWTSEARYLARLHTLLWWLDDLANCAAMPYFLVWYLRWVASVFCLVIFMSASHRMDMHPGASSFAWHATKCSRLHSGAVSPLSTRAAQPLFLSCLCGNMADTPPSFLKEHGLDTLFNPWAFDTGNTGTRHDPPECCRSRREPASLACSFGLCWENAKDTCGASWRIVDPIL